MQEVGRVVVKSKLGGGLNALCWAGAGFIAVKAWIKFDAWKNKNRDRADIKEGIEAIHELDDLMDKLEKKIVKEKTCDAKVETEEGEES